MFKKFVLIFFIISSVYFISLFSDFIYDDYHMVVNNELIKNLDLSNIKSFFLGKISSENIRPGMYRPLLMISYCFDYKFCQDSAFLFHLNNILLHIFNSLFFFLLLKKFFFQSEEKAFVLTLIFGLHPLNTQAVNFISARGDLFFTFFLLIAFYFYGRKKKLFSLFFFILSLLSKETALVFLPLIVFFDKFKHDKSNFKFYLTLVIIISLYLILRKNLFGTFLCPYRHRPLTEDFIFSLRSLFFYLGLWFIPYKQALIHLLNKISFYEVLGLFIFVVLTIAMIRAKFSPIFFLSLVWFFLPLSTPFFVSLFSLISEHRLYFSGFGLILFLTLVSKIERLYIIIPLLFFITFLRNIIWSDNIILWQDTIAKYPKARTAYLCLAEELLKRDRIDMAIENYKKALEFEPKDFKIYYDLGIAYGRKGDFKTAIEYFKKVIEIEPNFASAYNNLGISYLGLSPPDREKAKNAIDEALKLGYNVNEFILRELESDEEF